VPRLNWRTVGLVLLWAAIWWGLTFLATCDTRPMRPSELVPAEQQGDQK
jgi:hypothetical protein